jgi:hypothetical protein
MFGIKTDGLPTLRNYAEALAHHDSIEPIRGRYHPARPLGMRKKDHMTIRKLADGAKEPRIACRLYNTDVIVYHPDDSITITPWGSRSTDYFLHAVAPFGIVPLFTQHFASLVYTDSLGSDRAIRCPADGVTLRPDGAGWRLVTTAPEYPTYNLDRKRWNAAKKAARFDEYVAWCAARASLAGQDYRTMRTMRTMRTTQQLYRAARYADRIDVVARLREGPAAWEKLQEDVSIESVRLKLLQTSGAVIRGTKPYLSGQKELVQIVRGVMKYSWVGG